MLLIGDEVEPRGDLERREAVRAAQPLGVRFERGERRGDLVLAAGSGDEGVCAFALYDEQRHAQLRLRTALKIIENGRDAAARARLADDGVPDVRKEQLLPRREVLQPLHGGLDARAARGKLRRYRVLARFPRGDGHRHISHAAVKPDRLDELKVLDLPRMQERRAARKERERGERRAEPERALHFRSSFRSVRRRRARRREPGRESVSGER